MSQPIRWVLVVEILPAQLINFKEVVNDLVADSHEEPGTLGYEWYMNENDTVCHIYERFENSAAIMAHGATFTKHVDRFLAACKPIRFEVYGNPTTEARAAIADLKPTYFLHLAGFTR
jgi:quinol monooxygenase YgiN